MPRTRRGVDSALFFHGSYEVGTESVLRRYVRSGDTVVDVGAYIGSLTLIASGLVGPTGEVWSFEPNPDSYASLVRNLEHNGATNVHAVRSALGEETGEAGLHERSMNAGAATLLPASGEGRPVAVATLDSFLIAPRLIKIDVEGWEPAVIRGARITLTTHRPVVCVEVSRDTGAGEATIHELRTLGYDFFVLAGGKETRTPLVPMSGLPVHDNVIALPREGLGALSESNMRSPIT